MTDEHVAFSRNPYGKCDDSITFRIPYEARQKVRNLAYSLGLNESEFMLEMTMVRIEGLNHLASMDAARRLAVSGMPSERLTKEGQEPA
jgi:protein-disulfide isomerase-like protein with CxxC motif